MESRKRIGQILTLTTNRYGIQSLKNLESSFRQLRLFGIVFLFACTLVVLYGL